MGGGPAREARVRRYWQAVWTEGDVDAVHGFYAPTFRLNGNEISAERFARGAAAWRAHFDDFRVEVDRVFACGDVVVTRVVYRAAHVRDFETLPATGATFATSGLDVFEFDGDLVRDHWHETDHWDMYEQLGAEPRPRLSAPRRG